MLLRLLGLLVWSGMLAQAANIYVMASGNAAFDTELRRALESFGHSVTLGVPWSIFDGTQNLSGVDVVYLQANYNWGGPEMPAAGQTALVNFVNRGGGLVTTEWFLWQSAAGGFAILNPILPVNPTMSYDILSAAVTFTQNFPDGELNVGLPAAFRVFLDDLDGTRSLIRPADIRASASSFYTMDGGFIALAGWNAGSGRVLSFATLNGAVQLGDASFRRLLSNTMNWAVRPSVTEGGVVNAASFARGRPVAPGSLVSIFGSGLASSQVSADLIPLPTSLGGVSVTFNGIVAPVQFVSPRQINVQVPWEVLSGGATSGTASVVVRRGQAASEARPAQVSPSSPGIFSVESGTGQAIAFNEDGSLPAPAGSIPGIRSEPARIGGTVSILATGLGVVDPPGRDGQSSLDVLRRTLATPTVLIGGVQAQVRFSGMAPQFPGVYQLNVVVPAVTAGDRVPIQIHLGEITSTDRITIAVRN